MDNNSQQIVTLQHKLAQLADLRNKVPKIVAGAVEKMKDANFSAQGFVENGTASPRWAKRKIDTRKTVGKKVLFNTGYLQNNIKVIAFPAKVIAGVDGKKVPYAHMHNEGFHGMINVRSHHRTHYRTKKRYQVKEFAKRMEMPQRKYLGYSPDILKITQKEVNYQLKKIFG